MLFLQTVLISEASYVLCMTFTKFSLAALYLRIVYKSWHKWLIYGCVGIYALYSLVPFFVNMFQCGTPKPIHFLSPSTCPIKWDVAGPINYVAAVTNAAADWIMTFIPVMVIVHLQLPLKDKLSALTLVALGSIASCLSVARIPFISSLKVASDFGFFYRIEFIGYLSVFEAGLAIIATSASAYRPLWHKPSSNTTVRETDQTQFGHTGASVSRGGDRMGSRNMSVSASRNKSVASRIPSQYDIFDELEEGLSGPMTTVITSSIPSKQITNGIEKEKAITVSYDEIQTKH